MKRCNRLQVFINLWTIDNFLCQIKRKKHFPASFVQSLITFSSKDNIFTTFEQNIGVFCYMATVWTWWGGDVITFPLSGTATGLQYIRAHYAGTTSQVTTVVLLGDKVNHYKKYSAIQDPHPSTKHSQFTHSNLNSQLLDLILPALILPT